MSDYHISRIFPDDKREIKKLDALLEKEGIERDKNLDYTVGLYDDDYQLAATGSCFKNTLRCMAVDSSHQGEGLLNQIVTHLIDYEYSCGQIHLFLYTKCDKAMFFRDLGFYEIARVDGKVVFMENRKRGFSDYLERLKKETLEQCSEPSGRSVKEQEPSEPEQSKLPIGAVVMNANPFTLGHRYLLETASAACRLLHIFVVSEDVSLVPSDVRFRLVKEGASDLKNLIFHRTDSYLISSATFPSYFLRDEDTVIQSHARLDLEIFIKIAEALQIDTRFVGEEKSSHVTGIYNEVMEQSLAQSGLSCRILPRKTGPDGAISASTVRRLIHEDRLEAIQPLVPESTYRYFTSPESEPVIAAIKAQEDVVHY